MDIPVVFVVFVIVGIGLILIPGIIASTRNHAYKGAIWALSIIGSIFFGIGWVIALIWALWPTEKTLVDPIVGNATGIGSRKSGDVLG